MRFCWISAFQISMDTNWLAKIRAAPWGRGVFLIAATGWGQEEDRRRAFEAGFDHHLTKPIAAETVESLLQSLDPTMTVPDKKF